MSALRFTCFSLATGLILILCLWQPAQAAWTTNPSENTPVCDLGDNQDAPQMVSDGAGGMIIVWRDVRLYGWSFTFAQRLDASGEEIWQTNGVVVCPMEGNQVAPALVSDGAGGAVITWLDYRSGSTEIYAQRVDSSGAMLWTVEGVPICSSLTGNPWNPQITTDGAGGAIITWMDSRNGDWDIYAQRVDSMGNVQWATDGVALSTAVEEQGNPRIVSDGAGGAIVAWDDVRQGDYYDVYLQRVDASGNMLWTASGVSVGTLTPDEMFPRLLGDGLGGTWVTWPDERNSNHDIFAQRFDGAGNAVWAAGGVPVCTASGAQFNPWLVDDGSEGAIIAWQDDRSGTGSDIYAQRIDPAGNSLWTSNGIAVCTAVGYQHVPVLESDGMSGAILVWADFRSGTNYDLYAQRIDQWGSLLWETDGVAVSTAISHQLDPVLLKDGSGGAYIAWDDDRSGTDYDVYAQHVDFNGRRAGAAWSIDPNENNPVCTTGGLQGDPDIVSDGAGGAIITWTDDRSGQHIYAQRLGVDGSALWPTNGVPVCTASGVRGEAKLVGDDMGGAIIVWMDGRAGNEDIYAQRVDSTGALLWPADGVVICSASYSQTRPELVSDGTGGAIIVWNDLRTATTRDIYGQRVDAAGNVLWTPDGVLLAAGSLHLSKSQLVSDQTGGAIIAWHDLTSGYDIFAQRVSNLGTLLWDPNGIAVCYSSKGHAYPELVGDGAGGAIVVWKHTGISNYVDIYTQRVDASGALLWFSAGKAVCTGDWHKDSLRIVSDSEGGAIIAWADSRSGSSEIYAQHVVAGGAIHWETDGLRVCAALSWNPQLTSDGEGGAIIAWGGERSGFPGVRDISAQRLNQSGSSLWQNNGMPVCTAADTQRYPLLVADEVHGPIITWQDGRQGYDIDYDIFAQRISPNGYLGEPGPVISGIVDHPEDQGGLTVVNWAPSPYDEYPGQVVTHYSIWMHQPDDPSRSGHSDQHIDSLDDLERAGWVYLDEIPATYQEEYGYHAPTYEDWTGGTPFPLTEYKVIAHTSDPWVFWESGVRSGCSVDNLAPGAPLTLFGLPDEVDVLLSWEASGYHDADLAHYNVYRGTSPGFIPDESSLVGITTEIEYTDPSPGSGVFYYVVAGEDVHGNVGDSSNEAAVPLTMSTVAASLTCVPSSGTLPFTAGFTVQLTNQYSGQTRRIDGRIHVTTAAGRYYSNWRTGYTNVAAGGAYVTSWSQVFPALGTLVGDNLFRLVAADVTPAPYNQPPYPPAGDTDSDTATFTGIAP